MKVSAAIANILKREGVDVIFGYPRNAVLEDAAAIGIRPVIVRQERTGVHMADALSRLTRGKRMGVFAMQHGPGTENAYGGVAQAYSESVPVLVLPQGYARRIAFVPDNFNASVSMRDVTKHAEPITVAAETQNIMRRAFTQLRNGRLRPVLVEMPWDVLGEEIDAPESYQPVVTTRYAPEPDAVKRAAEALVAAKRPVIYAGQGVHWAEAYEELKALAELLAIPVSTSLEGKSAFDETHPLALGSGGAAISGQLRHFLDEADLIFGIGCSFSETAFGVKMPQGKRVIHSTLDPADFNKNVPCEMALAGDAKLTLGMLLEACRALVSAPRDAGPVAAEIAKVEKEWLANWLPLLESDDAPISPYRVLWDLQKTVDVANTIITHDAGSPRDQLTPYWKSITPLSYIGWGKSTQLGYGLGLAMGAKLACPDKLCINVWGDAAIGFTGMDFETAVRERLPILSILLNNEAMAIELPVMPVATERFRATDISGHYADFAKALGGHGERVTRPEEIVPAIHRALAAIEAGQPALIEFITAKETRASRL
ncbi:MULTISPECIES: thiamine pyrophosphate-requiring protein [unclassified Sphingobium]|uniref:thiamine pyrophosphate-requiring protein n=1 Tax=unclassified Sphingobium TaxID=2611147 RepID=UPI0022258598|nr:MULTISPECIES: thiamine pyrophosphate-requiring protein [unclassified Sphingobium]MCW2351091.1 acetolactate synthase-1/2/3 large subunit [Sphingobium sp. B12D2B]MCW2370307.1 acetolactate synthase-1/2/3 large subunit [Sphingobium sp. B11D3D]MCW2395285.1 acetolactate synthase-1/2/3 large subunit [Sphingobium sp. B8D3B]MCW2411386.1 acetolactate synthase-1/2/3 large subunit [Sphingobium sp. B8D3D]MCW2416321.1 acetolactate synthase-1/2/3 large subunit [Sphingobium sp. B8D3A]